MSSSDVYIFGTDGANAVPITVNGDGRLQVDVVTGGGGGGGGGISPGFTNVFGSASSQVQISPPIILGSRFVATNILIQYEKAGAAASLIDIINIETFDGTNGNTIYQFRTREQISGTQPYERFLTGINIGADNDEVIRLTCPNSQGVTIRAGIQGYYEANSA